MDFYLAQGSTRFHFPMNPEQVSFQAGPHVESYTILSLGDVQLPRGKSPSAIQWQGILPGAGRKNQPYVKQWRDPVSLDKQLRAWADDGTTLQLIVTRTSINLPVFITRYESTVKGGMGDVEYNIELTERRQIVVRAVGEAAASSTNTAKPVTRQSRPKPTTPRTYTVKPGDTLWSIAKRFSGNGANYQALYTLNKSVIGPDPNNLRVGQVLRLPAEWSA